MKRKIQRVSHRVLRRFLGREFLAILVIGILGGISSWLLLESHRSDKEEAYLRGKQQRIPPNQKNIVLTKLVAQELTQDTSSPQIRAGTAYLLKGWEILEVQNIDVQIPSIKSPKIPGFNEEEPISGFLRAQNGWVNLKTGNLVMQGDILGQSSDGKSITAKRLEYESKKDELRFSEASVRSKEGYTQTPCLVTNSHMTRLESKKKFPEGTGFFRTYGKGAN